MDEENKTNGNAGETHPQRTPRVRSRTVLLTSDMAGQVRSRLSSGGRESGFAGGEETGGFERQTPASASGLERRGEVTVTTQRPNFQPRPTVQRPEVEEEVPSHITRQRMEEAETPSAHEWQTRSEVAEQPETYALPERSVSNAEPSYAHKAPVESTPVVEKANDGGDSIVWSKEGALVGFLISYDKNENGTFFELRAGRLIVTSEFAGTGNFLYLNDPTVSPMHAILRCSKGTPIQVLDQLSECGTKIVSKEDNETKELAGDKGTLKHGDTVFFGERSFKVCLVED